MSKSEDMVGNFGFWCIIVQILQIPGRSFNEVHDPSFDTERENVTSPYIFVSLYSIKSFIDSII